MIQRRRYKALRLLTKIKNPLAEDPVLNALKDKDPGVRLMALKALTFNEIKSHKATALVLDMLKDDGWDIRDAAVLALGFIKDPMAIEPLTRLMK